MSFPIKLLQEVQPRFAQRVSNRGVSQKILQPKNMFSFQRYSLKPSFLRHASGHAIQPWYSQFMTRKLFDDIMFYAFVGFVPLGTFIFFYHSIHSSECELVDTPEGYEPQNHEYYSRPITQLLVKYFHSSNLQRNHEVSMHTIQNEQDSVNYRFLRQKVHNLMAKRADTHGYYYIPSNPARILESKKRQNEALDERGFSDDF